MPVVCAMEITQHAQTVRGLPTVLQWSTDVAPVTQIAPTIVCAIVVEIGVAVQPRTRAESVRVMDPRVKIAREWPTVSA